MSCGSRALQIYWYPIPRFLLDTLASDGDALVGQWGLDDSPDGDGWHDSSYSFPCRDLMAN